MRERLNIILVILLLIALAVPFVSIPVYASDIKAIDNTTYVREYDKKAVKISELQFGDKVILSSGQTSFYLGEGSKHKYNFTVDLGSLEYIPNTTTKINSRWIRDNATDWHSGDNLFYATVKGGKVETTYQGKKLSWQPDLYIDGKKVQPLSSYPILLTTDPYDSYYFGNILQWDYGTVKRQLRAIEGVLSEYWVFTSNPNGDVNIKSNLVKDSTFVWDRQSFAHDSEYREVPVILDKNDKIVLASDFNNPKLVYPVIVDPTTTYYATASDTWGGMYSSVSWATVTDSATAPLTTHSSSSTADIYNTYSSWDSNYWNRRAFLYLDTGGVGVILSVSAATLTLING